MQDKFLPETTLKQNYYGFDTIKNRINDRKFYKSNSKKGWGVLIFYDKSGNQILQQTRDFKSGYTIYDYDGFDNNGRDVHVFLVDEDGDGNIDYMQTDNYNVILF